MAQIQKGDTFADGQLVTAARLNALLDSAILNPNAITDQTQVSGGDIDNGDYLLVYDVSATALKKAYVTDILNSNNGSPIRTTGINGVSGYGISVGLPSGQTFTVNGNTSLAGATNTLAGDLNVAGILSITGTATFSSPITFSGSTIAGNATLNGNILIGAGKTLTLDSAPTTALQAATKAYVDSSWSKAFCKFNGSGGIMSAKNVTTVSRVSTGTYNVTFTTAMANADYIISASCTNSGATSGWVTIYNQTTSGFQIYTAYPVTYGGGQLPYDPTAVFFNVVSN